jgi:hypothetical protein
MSSRAADDFRPCRGELTTTNPYERIRSTSPACDKTLPVHHMFYRPDEADPTDVIQCRGGKSDDPYNVACDSPGPHRRAEGDPSQCLRDVAEHCQFMDPTDWRC